ncbi:MAG TPA: GTPase [Burkholderiales bacterium]|nr:GTPase [Burkholderiales bacterium]
MPANLSPEYKEAEQAYRRAREPRERLDCLKEMLRTIPKHKGTEHLQADIKSRIRELTDELAAPRKGGARSHAVALRREGAAQVCLVGPPNSGKSTLHAVLTGSHSTAGPFPFTTQAPVPGMLRFEDIAFQLVDLPPVAAEHLVPELLGVLQATDAAWLVVDLADPATPEQVLAVRGELARRKIMLEERWPGLGDEPSDDDDVFRVRLPTLLVANKSDLDPEPDEAKVLEELLGLRFPALSVSAKMGSGLGELAPFLVRALAIVRVYTKLPGKVADRSRPFTLRAGDRVLDVARLVHADVAASLKYARVWGSGEFDGQQVGPEHRVADGDVLELHAR